jgi:[acyl-carrier-protein] S-malonyltransferase
MKAFVFPGQGGGVSEPAPEMVPKIQRVVGERIPDQVKIFVRAARDADESRTMNVRPDVVAGHSLGEYGAAYAAGCFDFETGLWLVAQRDHFLAEAARECPGGMVAILRTDPAEVEKALGGPGGPVVANYNSPRQTVVSGLRDALGDAVSKIRGRKIPLNVSFAAHSPYVAAAGEKMRGVLDSVEFQVPQVPIVSAIDGAVLTRAEAVKEALKEQMVAPVRWVRVVAGQDEGGGVDRAGRRRRPDANAQRLRVAVSDRYHVRGPSRPPLRAGPEPAATQRRRIGFRL